MWKVNEKGMTSAAAKSYFKGGIWGGKLAEWLKLSGEALRSHFEKMCDGLNPFTGEKLSPGTKEERIAGWDITASAPKPVTLLYLATRDESIPEGFVAACDYTMDHAEELTKSRVRKGGAAFDRISNNWAYTGETHWDARPHDSTMLPSPQLHRHHLVYNASFDPVEQEIKALQIGAVKGEAYYYMPLMHNEHAKHMRSLGYGIEKTGTVGFGIVGVPRSLVEEYSPRNATIKKSEQRIAEKEGITDPRRLGKLRSSLALATRRYKNKELGQDELFEIWDRQMSDKDRQTLLACKGLKGWETTNREAMAYGRDQALEHKTRVPEKRMLAPALNYGVGSVSLEGLRSTYQELGIVVEKDGMLTTPQRLEQEGRIIDFAREGRGTMRPLGVTQDNTDGFNVNTDPTPPSSSAQEKSRPEGRLNLAITKQYKDCPQSPEPTTALTEQQAIYSHVLNSPDQFILVSGKVKPLEHEKIIWLENPAVDELDKHCAGDKRIVLNNPNPVADKGDIFYQLRKHLPVGKKVKGSLYEVRESVNKGDIVKAYDIMRGLEAVKHEGDYKQIAQNYLERSGIHCMVVAPANKDADAITGEIRQRLHQAGKLGSDHDIETLIPLHWPDAKKSDVYQYTGDEVIQFSRSIGPYKAGARYAARNMLAQIHHINPANYHLFARSQTQLAEGDKVRTTHAGWTLPDARGGRHRIIRGWSATIRGLSETEVVFDNGWRVPRDFGHLTHDYVNGSGKDRAIIIAPKAREAVAAIKQYGSQKLRSLIIYTQATDAEILREAKPKAKPKQKVRERAAVLMRQAADEFMELLQDQTSGARETERSGDRESAYGR